MLLEQLYYVYCAGVKIKKRTIHMWYTYVVRMHLLFFNIISYLQVSWICGDKIELTVSKFQLQPIIGHCGVFLFLPQT